MKINRFAIYIATIMTLGCGKAYGAIPEKTPIIEMVADNLKLTLMVGEDKRVYQLSFGDADASISLPEKTLTREQEFLPAYGNGVITESAIQATHTDGNTSTDLKYLSHRCDTVSPDITQTVISLRDFALSLIHI